MYAYCELVNLYGFNGMEKDDEVKGSGNSYTTHFRQLDPRLGRWLSIDPKMSAWESPYVSMGDSPIWYSDPMGDTVGVSGSKEDKSAYLNKLNGASDAQFGINGKGQLYQTNDVKMEGKFLETVQEAMENEQLVNLNLVNDKDGVAVDAFSSGDLDVSDLKGATNEAFKSSMIHILTERFSIQDYEKVKGDVFELEFLIFHDKALGAEAEYLKELYPGYPIKYKYEKNDKKSIKTINGQTTIITRVDFKSVQLNITSVAVKVGNKYVPSDKVISSSIELKGKAKKVKK